MKTTTIMAALLCGLCVSAEASSFRRDDATLGAQADRAEHVAVATVAAIRRLGEHDQEVLLQVEEALKGPEAVTLSFVSDRDTTLTPRLRVGQRALFFLSRKARAARSSCRGCPQLDTDGHEDFSAGRLVLDRGPRSARDLSGPDAGHVLALTKAHLRAELDPAGLVSELVEAVVRAPGALAADSAQELLNRVTDGARLSAAQGQALVGAFAGRRDELTDRAPLVRLLGRVEAQGASAALLRSVGDAEGFDPDALSEALRSQPDAARVLSANLARNPSQRIRARAARLLGRLGTADAALVRAARWDAEPKVRGEALLALGRRGGAAAATAVRAAFADPERSALERRAAAVALVALGEARQLAEVEDGFVTRLRRSPSLARHELLRSLR